MDRTIERPGHFIGSQECAWGRITMCDRYFVSSVGEYRPYGEDGLVVEIGHGRFYETYVFPWDGRTVCGADGCNCGLPEPDSWDEIDGLPANTREECERNHATMVEKWRHAPAQPPKEDVDG